MTSERKIFDEWLKELNIRVYSTSRRKLEEYDNHIRKLSAKKFISLLKTVEYTFDNRNIFNKKLIAFSNKHNIKKEFIANLLEMKRDDFVKFKLNNKIQIGRYQGELNNGKDLVGIEVNGKEALNYFYVEKSKILFPTKKEILKTLKKESDSKTERDTLSVPENYSDNQTG
jgi:hypothetical protein